MLPAAVSAIHADCVSVHTRAQMKQDGIFEKLQCGDQIHACSEMNMPFMTALVLGLLALIHDTGAMVMDHTRGI